MSNNSSVICQDKELSDGNYLSQPQEEQSVMIASFVISSLLLFYFMISLPLFHYYQKKLKHLRVRSFGLLCASTLGMVMIIAVSSVSYISISLSTLLLSIRLLINEMHILPFFNSIDSELVCTWYWVKSFPL